MMVDKIVRSTEVGPPISCSPLVNASLGPQLIVTYTVPCYPSSDCFSCFFLASTYFTVYDNKTKSPPGLGASPPCLHFLVVPGGAATSSCSLFQVIGLRVLIMNALYDINHYSLPLILYRTPKCHLNTVFQETTANQS